MTAPTEFVELVAEARRMGFSLEEAERTARQAMGEPARQTEAPTLRVVPLAGLMHTDPPAPDYAVEQFAPVNEVTLAGGHGGAGKTIFATTLSAHYAAGVPWFGFSTKGGRAVYVSLEDPAHVMRFRLRKIIEAYELDAAAVKKNLVILDGSDGSGAMMTEVSEFGVRALKRTPLFDEVEKAAKGAGLIIIDNASDAYDGDEVKRRQVRRFIRELRQLAKDNTAGLILLAHIDKAAARNGSQGNSYSGSTAWHNSVRSRLALVEKNGSVELVQEKLNLGKKLERPIPLTWVDGVLVPDCDVAEGFDVEAQGDLDRMAVLEAVTKAIADGEDVPTARTGPKTTQNVLERYPDLPAHLRGKKGREAFYGALTALHREGTLSVEEYTTPARHVREKYVCADSSARTYTPYTPYAEPAKPAQGRSPVAGVAPITETSETSETGADEKGEVLL